MLSLLAFGSLAPRAFAQRGDWQQREHPRPRRKPKRRAPNAARRRQARPEQWRQRRARQQAQRRRLEMQRLRRQQAALRQARQRRAVDDRRAQMLRALAERRPRAPVFHAPLPRPAVIARREMMSPKPPRLPPAPKALPGGAAFPTGTVVHPPLQHAQFAEGPQGAAALSLQANENRSHFYYWHSYAGGNYVHYYYGGYHWYGFQNGPSWYWTRYYYNRWWWYDPGAARWVYYNGGYWWWQNPSVPGATYVYVGGEYVPYAQAQAQYSASLAAASPAAVSTAAVALSTPSAAAPAYASDIDIPTYQMPVSTDSYALVVGVENYESLPKAEFAARDAQTMHDHLLHLGYPERNIILLTDGRATRSSVIKYVEKWLVKKTDAGSRVFVYFGGHGAPDPKDGTAYLMPWDADPKYLSDTGYPLKRLYDKLRALPAKTVFVALDSCFSGSGGRSVLPAGARPLVTSVNTARDAAGRLIVYTASGADEITGVDREQGHGLFTYYFLRGVNGGADVDGRVTVQGLFDYLQPDVEDAARRDNRDQTPQLIVPPDGARELAIRKDPPATAAAN